MHGNVKPFPARGLGSIHAHFEPIGPSARRPTPRSRPHLVPPNAADFPTSVSTAHGADRSGFWQPARLHGGPGPGLAEMVHWPPQQSYAAPRNRTIAPTLLGVTAPCRPVRVWRRRGARTAETRRRSLDHGRGHTKAPDRCTRSGIGGGKVSWRWPRGARCDWKPRAAAAARGGARGRGVAVAAAAVAFAGEPQGERRLVSAPGPGGRLVATERGALRWRLDSELPRVPHGHTQQYFLKRNET